MKAVQIEIVQDFMDLLFQTRIKSNILVCIALDFVQP